jgi:hypothetical protein
MRFGFIGMTLKQKGSHCYGRVLVHYASEKHGKCTLTRMLSASPPPNYFGIFHREFIPAGHVANQAYYLEGLRHVTAVV